MRSICIASKVNIPKNSPLWSLDPFIDSYELLRVRGRLAEANLGPDEKRPLILPGRHHIAILLVRHFHEQTQHQGCHFTEGAIRSAGFWIVGGKRCVSKVIFEFVTCRKVIGKCEVQKLADLPSLTLAWMYLDPGLYLHVALGEVMLKVKGGQSSSPV